MEIIQSMLSPAVMISACGLILLTLVPRLGRVIDRIRILAAERRELGNNENLNRIKVINNQIKILLMRSKLLQLSSQFLFLAILLFVICSITIGISQIFKGRFLIPSTIFFMGGMISTFLGIVFSYKEIKKSLASVIEEINIKN